MIYGGCSCEDKYLFLTCSVLWLYVFPSFIDANLGMVSTESIQNEINDLIKLSDGIGISEIHLFESESTKFEIESVIARCETQG